LLRAYPGGTTPLIEDPLGSKLLAPMLDISRGLSLGDSSLLKLARMDLIKELRSRRQDGILDQLRSVPSSGAPLSSRELAESALPELLLNAFASGGLGGVVAKDGPIAEMMSRMRGGSSELFLDQPSSFAAVGESMLDIEWPQGQVVDLDGRVWSAESAELGDGLTRVSYTGDREGDGPEVITRLELPIAFAAERASEAEAKDPRRKKKLPKTLRERHQEERDQEEREDQENTAGEDDVVYVFLASLLSETLDLVGTTSFAMAAMARDEIEALNRSLPSHERIAVELHGHCARPLIKKIGFETGSNGALIVHTTGRATELAAREAESIRATFFPAATQLAEPRWVSQDHLEDLELMQNGVLFYQRYGA
jgi:hypothetical protein